MAAIHVEIAQTTKKAAAGVAGNHGLISGVIETRRVALCLNPDRRGQFGFCKKCRKNVGTKPLGAALTNGFPRGAP